MNYVINFPGLPVFRDDYPRLRDVFDLQMFKASRELNKKQLEIVSKCLNEAMRETYFIATDREE